MGRFALSIFPWNYLICFRCSLLLVTEPSVGFESNYPRYFMSILSEDKFVSNYSCEQSRKVNVFE